MPIYLTFFKTIRHIGLSCARALALAGRDVVILEAANMIGSEISARNSEVIHAGIDDPAFHFSQGKFN